MNSLAQKSAPRRIRRAAPDRSSGFGVIVINRDDADERLAFQKWQMAELRLKFHRLDAYRPEHIPGLIQESYWRRWRHPLTNAQRARFLSHGLAWEWVTENGPALIIEDDIVLARSVPEILNNLRVDSEMEHLCLEVGKRRKLMGRDFVPIAHGVSSHRLHLDRSGAAAYVLWPSGARKLIGRAKRGAKSIDGLSLWAPNLRSYQADPACAVQLDVASDYGLGVPIKTVSTVEKARKGGGSVGQRVRVVGAQIHKLARRLRYAMSAQRRKVTLRPEFFDL